MYNELHLLCCFRVMKLWNECQLVSKYTQHNKLKGNFSWLNSSFSPLTFPKLRFWPPRPILTQSTLTWHPKGGATCFFFFLCWGIKTATVAKLRERFCSFFFLGGQNHNFVKVRGRKLLLSLFLLANCKHMLYFEPKGLFVLGIIMLFESNLVCEGLWWCMN